MFPVAGDTDVVNAAHSSMFPAVEASKVAHHPTLPHDPVAAGNVIANAFVISPDADVFHVDPVVATLAYALPVTSVPPPASDGAAVNSATHTDGMVNAVFPMMWLLMRSSR